MAVFSRSRIRQINTNSILHDFLRVTKSRPNCVDPDVFVRHVICDGFPGRFYEALKTAKPASVVSQKEPDTLSSPRQLRQFVHGCDMERVRVIVSQPTLR